MATDDPDLVARVAAGDDEALRELVSRHHASLRRYLWSQLDGDVGAVEEAVQDVFVAVWRGAAAYRAEAKVSTWLFQIARFLALRARRGQRRAAGLALLEAEEGEDAPSGWPGSSHEDAVIDRLTLAECLRQLSDKHREALELVFVFGFSPDEVARILGVPSGTVKSRISYARRALFLALDGAAAKEA